MKKVNMHEAKTQLSKIVKEVEAGEQYIIGKSGNPVALLIPYTEEKRRRKPGTLKGQISYGEELETQDDEVFQLFEDSVIEPL